MGNVFSVSIFFIALRETIEAGIVVSVLLGLVENLVDKHGADPEVLKINLTGDETPEESKKKALKRMRWLILGGSLVGFFIALCIGAAFIAVFFTTLNDLWGKSEQIWEGVFSVIAAIIIFVMGIAMLRIDRSKLKWQIKLQAVFDKQVKDPDEDESEIKREGRGIQWTLFLLPLITVLREGLEAVVFIGGVSLGQRARAIPLAAIVGLIAGLLVALFIYYSGSRISLSIFLVISTNILFLLGAGLFSKSVWDFQYYVFAHGVGGDVAETGDGPGSFNVRGNVWHLTYGNPEVSSTYSPKGWDVFNAILGWQNTATLGSILSYVFYWIAAIVVLLYMKWSEGRTSFFGRRSAAGKRRLERRAQRENRDAEKTVSDYSDSGDSPLEKNDSPLEKAESSFGKTDAPIEEVRTAERHI